MLSLFQRKKVDPAAVIPTPPAFDSANGLLQPESAASLLATPRRQKLLEYIWQRTSVSRSQFASLYRAPLEHYAELVQQFPASENHHHAWPGGMLDHGLEIVAYALLLRQSHLLPAGATPESQAAQAEAWTAGAAYAALLHDLGKIAVDLHVEYADGTVWHPWHGPLKQAYRFRYRKDRQYRLHSAATGLLYVRVLDARILDWLSDYPDLWAALLFVLAGQYEHAGVLGELVVQADQASVAHALGGDPARALAAPRQALQRKLLDGLRYLLKEELKLNQPQASDGWLTQDALWLVSKTVSDKLRAHLLAQGVEGIPSNNTALFTIMQDHGLLQPTPEGKAIWRATVASSAGWSHSFTLLRVAPALIWERGDRPEPFAGTVTVDTTPESADAREAPDESAPVGTAAAARAVEPATPAARAAESQDNTDRDSTHTSAVDELLSMFDTAPRSPPASFSEPSAHSIVPVAGASSDPRRGASAPKAALDAPVSAEHFVAWLKHGVQSRKLIINDAKALVHTVADTAYLVSPGLFQRYAQEHPQVQSLAKADALPDWRWVQKHFEKLQLHRKQSNRLNIWTCDVTGPRKSKRLHGYLLNDPMVLFDTVPPNNPYLSLSGDRPQNESI